MTKIPAKVKKLIENEDFYKTCSLYNQHGHICEGRVTFDHVVIFAGKQVQELWAIIPICAHGHGVDGFQDDASVKKEMRLWVALNRAPAGDLVRFSKVVDYTRELARLNGIYGRYERQVPSPSELLQNIPAIHGGDWYAIPVREQQRIEKIRTFNSGIGSPLSKDQVISTAIEDMYLSIGNHLLGEDKELYKKLGFDK